MYLRWKMTNYQSFLEGQVDGWGMVQTKDLVFSVAFLEACKTNRCGNYGKSWVCPPAINPGLLSLYQKYQNALIISKISPLEDPFDLEGMNRGREVMQDLIHRFQTAFPDGNYRLLGPGACSLCRECAYPDHACLHPERAVPPLEALGIDVLSLARTAKLKYYNGPRTITYFAAIFFD
jgi:predicted metal-binding protein